MVQYRQTASANILKQSLKRNLLPVISSCASSQSLHYFHFTNRYLSVYTVPIFCFVYLFYANNSVIFENYLLLYYYSTFFSPFESPIHLPTQCLSHIRLLPFDLSYAPLQKQGNKVCRLFFSHLSFYSHLYSPKITLLLQKFHSFIWNIILSRSNQVGEILNRFFGLDTFFCRLLFAFHF